MPIKFRCPSCNNTLTAPDKFAGGSAKCQLCQTKIRIPKPSTGGHATPPVPAATPKPDATDNNMVDGSSNKWSERKILGVVVGGAVVLLVVFVTVLLTTKHFREKERAELLVAMTTELSDSTSEADRLVVQFQFDEALAQFDGIAPRIRESPVANFELKNRLENALAAVHSAERDYKAKSARGWAMFEGRFISRQDRTRILEQRKEDALAAAISALHEAQSKAISSDDWGEPRASLKATLSNSNLDSETEQSVMRRFEEFAVERIIADSRRLACDMVMNNDPMATPAGAQTLIAKIASLARTRWNHVKGTDELPGEASEVLANLSADIKLLSLLDLNPLHDMASSKQQEWLDAEGRQFFGGAGFLVLRNAIDFHRKKFTTARSDGDTSLRFTGQRPKLTPVLDALRDESMRNAVRMLLLQYDSDMALADKLKKINAALIKDTQDELVKRGVEMEFSMSRLMYYQLDTEVLKRGASQFQSWYAREFVNNILRIAPDVLSAAERAAEATVRAARREELAARAQVSLQQSLSRATPKATADQYAEMLKRNGEISSYRFAGVYFVPTVMAGKILVTDGEYRTALGGLVDASIGEVLAGGNTRRVITTESIGIRFTETPPDSQYVAVVYEFNGGRLGRIVVEKRGNGWIGRVATLDGHKRTELGQ